MFVEHFPIDERVGWIVQRAWVLGGCSGARRFLWMVHLSDPNDHIIAGSGFREDLTVVVGDHLSDLFQLLLLQNEFEGLAGRQQPQT